MSLKLIDFEGQDIQKFESSLKTGFELFTQLHANLDKYITPLFPSYYQINQAVKDVYVSVICDHLKQHHVPHLEVYMESSPPILLEAFHFIREVAENAKMLNEPNNQEFRALYIQLSPCFPQFLKFSESEFSKRFANINKDQRNQEHELIEESEQWRAQEARRAAHSKEQKNYMAVIGKHGLQRRQNQTLYTTFVQDVFDFMDTQLE